MVLSQNLLQLTLAEVPCFHKIKIVHKIFLKMNVLLPILLDSMQNTFIMSRNVNAYSEIIQTHCVLDGDYNFSP